MRVWGVRLLPAATVLLRPGLAGLPAGTSCCVPASFGSVKLRDREAVPACVARTKPSRACIAAQYLEACCQGNFFPPHTRPNRLSYPYQRPGMLSLPCSCAWTCEVYAATQSSAIPGKEVWSRDSSLLEGAQVSLSVHLSHLAACSVSTAERILAGALRGCGLPCG